MNVFFAKSCVLSKLTATAVLLLVTVCVFAQTSFTAKVYGLPSEGRYYGRLYLPKGAKWRISKAPAAGVKVTVYAGHVDGSDIYLNPVMPLAGYVWIEATTTDHIFVMRSTSTADVLVEAVTSEQDAEFLAEGYDYYDAGNAKKNRFRYAAEQVTSEVMKDNSLYNTRNSYVMANPAKNGLAFALVNPDVNTGGIPKGSLYVLTKKSSASRLNVIFTDDDDLTIEEGGGTTAIRSVAPVAQDDDAPVYSLQGTRVTQPLKGHLYIKNGRKFVQR